MEIDVCDNMVQERFFEELSMNAHPSLTTQLYDGWVLRFANGYTKRANSISPIYHSGLPPLEKIEHCEKLCFSKNFPAVFKLTHAFSDELDKILEDKEYKLVEPTNVMTMSLDGFKYGSSDFTVKNYADEEWLNSYFSFGNYTEEIKRETAKQIINSVQNTKFCGLIVKHGKIVACGSCVIERGYAALLNIIVDEAQRGKGYGYEICASLLGEAVRHGAVNTYLQVVQANTKAVNLYTKLGYKKLYEYWYRVKNN